MGATPLRVGTGSTRTAWTAGLPTTPRARTAELPCNPSCLNMPPAQFVWSPWMVSVRPHNAATHFIRPVWPVGYETRQHARAVEAYFECLISRPARVAVATMNGTATALWGGGLVMLHLNVCLFSFCTYCIKSITTI